ncbi:MAG TPA: Ig-like domain-containing protein [Acidimicrobiales bacterium]|nr:Ig-like domain-containing protein [Acidimicrobiales bacterium]
MTAAVASLAAVAPAAGARPRTKTADVVPPTVSITAPAGGATVSGTVAVSGSASDNVGVSAVAVAVDGGAWATASGTSSWSWAWSAAGVANGAHTIAARATDAAGNTSTTSATVTVSNPVADTTAPSVAIGAPAAGSTVSGTVAVSGTSSDNTSVARVDVAVDGGPYATASGTSSWSWSWASSTVANGTHTITARATDTSGNAASASRTVTVSNPVADTTAPAVAVSAPAAGATVTGSVAVAGTASDNAGLSRVDVAVDGGAWNTASGTSSWSWSWASGGVANGSHTVTARATDTSGNATTASVTVSVQNSTVAPTTQGSWVSPEGVHINVNSAGPWTISQIYTMLLQNAEDLATIAPDLTVNVQDQYASMTQVSAGQTNGVFTSYKATTNLQGVNSTFATSPDYILSHEYGHVWANYMLYLVHNGDWSTYLGKRWTNSDGTVVLATDSRLDSSYSWNRFEIIADDYRLLFGSSLAISEHPYHLNTQIPDPRNVTGLKDFLATTWR